MRPWFCRALSLIALLFVMPVQADTNDISRIFKSTPSLEHFEICYGGGCVVHPNVSISPNEWRSVIRLFDGTQSPENEREAISQAIGMLERVVGEKTGTSADRAGTFNNSDFPNQLDCNDEAINSTTYMRLMKQHGLLRFHKVLDMRTRKFFFTGWPHTTAVIQDTTNQDLFAVDAWFYDNGEPAVIIPFSQWKEGWRPQASHAE